MLTHTVMNKSLQEGMLRGTMYVYICTYMYICVCRNIYIYAFLCICVVCASLLALCFACIFSFVSFSSRVSFFRPCRGSLLPARSRTGILRLLCAAFGSWMAVEEGSEIVLRFSAWGLSSRKKKDFNLPTKFVNKEAYSLIDYRR